MFKAMAIETGNLSRNSSFKTGNGVTSAFLRIIGLIGRYRKRNGLKKQFSLVNDFNNYLRSIITYCRIIARTIAIMDCKSV